VYGKRAEKFAALGALGLDNPVWQDARDGWDAPFTPAGGASWDDHPALDDLLPVRSGRQGKPIRSHLSPQRLL
jgi:hypothetical protein